MCGLPVGQLKAPVGSQSRRRPSGQNKAAALSRTTKKRMTINLLLPIQLHLDRCSSVRPSRRAGRAATRPETATKRTNLTLARACCSIDFFSSSEPTPTSSWPANRPARARSRRRPTKRPHSSSALSLFVCASARPILCAFVAAARQRRLRGQARLRAIAQTAPPAESFLSTQALNLSHCAHKAAL